MASIRRQLRKFLATKKLEGLGSRGVHAATPPKVLDSKKRKDLGSNGVDTAATPKVRKAGPHAKVPTQLEEYEEREGSPFTAVLYDWSRDSDSALDQSEKCQNSRVHHRAYAWRLKQLVERGSSGDRTKMAKIFASNQCGLRRDFMASEDIE